MVGIDGFPELDSEVAIDSFNLPAVCSFTGYLPGLTTVLNTYIAYGVPWF